MVSCQSEKVVALVWSIPLVIVALSKFECVLYREHCRKFSVLSTNHCSTDLLTQILQGKTALFKTHCSSASIFYSLPLDMLHKMKMKYESTQYQSVSWRVITIVISRQKCDFYRQENIMLSLMPQFTVKLTLKRWRQWHRLRVLSCVFDPHKLMWTCMFVFTVP